MARTLKVQNGDVVRSYTNQSYTYVTDTDKCKQDVEMVLTTDVRTVTGLGCGLDDLLGQDTMNPISGYAQLPIVFDFQNRVRIGLSRLRTAQRQYLFSQRTPKELIFDFSPAEVWLTAEDPRNLKWNVAILSIDGNAGFTVGGGVRV